ncbi:uncharacterized protein LOC116207181 [Punica granatum]|uniref:Uncharacterized protein LOC116207181 n=1 Tax=Punica granatum TaxID=22663 RepID=A0A6P8DUR2_PUNGR|nr:uncharacterized protein LOC116207181 [Punica granatum]
MDPSRISLRPFALSDVDDLLSWAGDDRVTRFFRWDIRTREEALAHLKNVAIPHPWRRSICLDGHSIGYISVRPGSGDERHRAYVSYAIGADLWGQGIGTFTLRSVVSEVFGEFPDLVRLEALVDVENKGSQRVLDKAGFLREGCLRKYSYYKGEVRDMFMYSLLSTDDKVVVHR